MVVVEYHSTDEEKTAVPSVTVSHLYLSMDVVVIELLNGAWLLDCLSPALFHLSWMRFSCFPSDRLQLICLRSLSDPLTLNFVVSAAVDANSVACCFDTRLHLLRVEKGHNTMHTLSWIVFFFYCTESGRGQRNKKYKVYVWFSSGNPDPRIQICKSYSMLRCLQHAWIRYYQQTPSVSPLYAKLVACEREKQTDSATRFGI